MKSFIFKFFRLGFAKGDFKRNHLVEGDNRWKRVFWRFFWRYDKTASNTKY